MASNAFKTSYFIRVSVWNKKRYVISPALIIILSAYTEIEKYNKTIITYHLNRLRTFPPAYISNHSAVWMWHICWWWFTFFFPINLNFNFTLWRFDRSENSREKINWYEIFVFRKYQRAYNFICTCVLFLQLISVSLFICSFQCKHLGKRMQTIH